MTVSVHHIDHVSITVPDLDQAVAFFTQAFGLAEIERGGYTPPPNSREMDRYNAHAEASYRVARMDLAGTVLEIFEYTAPDLDPHMPRNCDAGGHHLGLGVDDVFAAVERLSAIDGVVFFSEPNVLADDHPTLAGHVWVYLNTPWGLHLELNSGPGVGRVHA